MASTAGKAGALYGVLQALGSGARPQVDLGIDPADLAGRPAREIVDRIAEALRNYLKTESRRCRPLSQKGD